MHEKGRPGVEPERPVKMGGGLVHTPHASIIPGPDQPGTLWQQLSLVHVFLLTDARRRRSDRVAVWQACRRLVLPHAGSPWRL